MSSVLPSPKTDFKCRDYFKEATLGLKNLVGHGNPKATFMNLTKQFLENGEPKNYLYSDRIHLTFKGAKILADCILKHCMKLPNKIWS